MIWVLSVSIRIAVTYIYLRYNTTITLTYLNWACSHNYVFIYYLVKLMICSNIYLNSKVLSLFCLFKIVEHQATDLVCKVPHFLHQFESLQSNSRDLKPMFMDRWSSIQNNYTDGRSVRLRSEVQQLQVDEIHQSDIEQITTRSPPERSQEKHFEYSMLPENGDWTDEKPALVLTAAWRSHERSLVKGVQ